MFRHFLPFISCGRPNASAASDEKHAKVKYSLVALVRGLDGPLLLYEKAEVLVGECRLRVRPRAPVPCRRVWIHRANNA